MAFTEKKLKFEISLVNGVFDGGGNSVTIKDVRASCRIVNAGPPSMGMLSADIYGLSLSLMNQLTVLGYQQNFTAQNKITVSAGDDVAGMSIVFVGTIDVAFCNAQAMPQVSFHIQGHAGSYESVKPVQPTSVQGKGDVAQIIGQLAGQMGLQFENNGVSAQLSNPYLSGTAWTQVLSAAEHAGIGWVVENGTLAIWPAGGAREGSTTPLVSPQTGLIGYPTYTPSGVSVRTLFDPSQQIKFGGAIQVHSDLQPACGTWKVLNLEYSLQSQTPRGDWYAIVAESSRMDDPGPA